LGYALSPPYACQYKEANSGGDTLKKKEREKQLTKAGNRNPFESRVKIKMELKVT